MDEKRMIEVKVSSDQGDTWHKRKIDMADLDESGLRSGEIFQFQGEQYKVLTGDGGLQVERLKKPIVKQKVVNRFK